MASQSYGSWDKMVRRCTRQADPDYPKYGGAGISVCERWLSFKLFLEDMGEKPTRNHTIDRIDNSKGYSKDNCRWVSRVIQNRNRKQDKVCGVYWRKHRSKWQARISVDEREISLGYFTDKADAIKARLSAEQQYWGRNDKCANY